MTSSTDLDFGREEVARARRTARIPWRSILGIAVLLAATTGYAIGHALDTATPAVESELVTLLRFMAILKLAMALGAAALASWRLSHPVGARLGAAYLASATLMAVAPGLIWHMATVAPGAIAFHLGLFAFLGLAVVDQDGRVNLAEAARARLRSR